MPETTRTAAPALYGVDLAGFLGRRRRMLATLAEVLEARDACFVGAPRRLHLHARAVRLAGALQGTRA